MSIVEMINTSIHSMFSYWPLIILLNVFFIYASYTDIKTMKIYNKFNIIMLFSRIITFIIMLITKDLSVLSFLNYLFGAIIMFLSFLIPAMITLDSIGGDIKFAFNVGLWVGIIPSLLITLIGSITNFLWRILFVGSEDKDPYFKMIKNVPVFFKAKNRVPLGPFFYFGYIILAIYYLIFLI